MRLIIIIFLISISFTALAEGADTPNIAFIGSDPDTLVRQWYPVITYLEKETGKAFNIAFYESQEDYLSAYKEGRVDLAIIGALHYAMIREEAGAVPIAGVQRTEKNTLKGVIITRQDRNLKNLSDLKGKKFAFTEPYSTAGYLMPRLYLADHGILDPLSFFKTVTFSGHHGASMDAVESGRVDAASVAEYFVNIPSLYDRTKFAVLAETGESASEIICARKDLSEKILISIKNALLDMNKNVSPDVMNTIGVSRFTEVDDRDYDGVRAMIEKDKGLPPIPYTIDYGQMPAAIGEALYFAKQSGFRWLASVPVFFVLSLILFAIIKRRRLRRDIKFKFIFSLALLLIVISITVSAVNFANLSERLGATAMRWQKNINVFLLQAAEVVQENTGSLQTLVDGLATQEGFTYVKVFRNGIYIADSEHKDVGQSIIPKIISRTFWPTGSQKQVNCITYLAKNDKKIARAQLVLAKNSLTGLVRKAAVNNFITIFIISLMGFGIAIYWAFVVLTPISKLSRLLAKSRGIEVNKIANGNRDQIEELEESFDEMQSELSQTQGLLQQKAAELDSVNQQLSGATQGFQYFQASMADYTKEEMDLPEAMAEELGSLSGNIQRYNYHELKEKIKGIEKDIPLLKEIRHTKIIGNAPAFLKVIRDIVIRSKDSDPVLIYGESGAGKTGVAEAIHILSARSDKKFVEYNCAELAAADPVLVLGKLFGYGRDSGLQNVNREGQKGLLEECNGATLFLDEVALLPLQAQGILLLPLEGRAFNLAAGKGAPKNVDVRFIFASNVSLEEEVKAGRFRNDLLRRIKAHGCIGIPPLRERKEDIEKLTSHFLKKIGDKKNCVLNLNKEALGLLKNYDFRSFNVAELASAIRVGADNAIFHGRDTIEPQDFSGELKVYYNRTTFMPEGQTFDEEEKREIAALRENNFNIISSESKLGYSQGSKTLSNHLRGISYKVLSIVDWNVEAAAAVLAGGDNPVAKARMERKINDYLANISSVIGGQNEKRVFNNLPQKHHKFAEELILRAKNPTSV